MKPSEIIRFKQRQSTDGWRERGACTKAVRAVKADESLSPDQRFKESQRINNLFFPPREAGPADFDEAKSYCRSCPVRAECLAYSLVCWERVGIWGGETETRRRATRKKMQAAKVKVDDAVRWCIKYLSSDEGL